MTNKILIHATAEVHPDARVGAGSQIWNQSQVRAGASLGEGCVIGKGVYIDAGVQIGKNVKIQNGVSVYHGVTIEDGVFCGPHCVFTNDKNPRAINPDGSLKGDKDWVVTPTLIKYGASIGAHATIVCGVTIGSWAMIGAGAVVTRDVPAHGIVVGCPAQLIGFACSCGSKMNQASEELYVCGSCGNEYDLNELDATPAEVVHPGERTVHSEKEL